MGCGASAERPPSVAVLNPGDLRDRSLQDTVELQGGIAKAGVRATNDSTKPSQGTNQDGLRAATQPSKAVSLGLTQLPTEPRNQTESAKQARPPSATSVSHVTAPTVLPGSARQPASCKPSRPASESPYFSAAGPAPTPETSVKAQQQLAPAPQTYAAAPPLSSAASSPQQPQSTQGQQPVPSPEAPAGQPRMVNCAVSLQFLIDFCATVPEDMPTWRVVTDVIVPATAQRRCRYVELLEEAKVGRCDYFISHRWATPFSHLVRYVRKHLIELGDVREAAAGQGTVVVDEEEKGDKGGDARGDFEDLLRTADKVFVWCDIFAINQHPGQVQADDLSQLKDCVVESQQTLLCLDDKGLVLTRIWCLYEIWNTVLAGGPPKLAVLGYDVNQDAFKEVYITLDVEEAQATVESDRVRILADIAASTGLQELNLVIKRGLVESTQAEAENAQKALLPRARDWRDYQRVIEAINKHTQMLVALGRHQEAQRYGFLIQSVSTAWQKSTARKTSSAGTAPAAAAAAAVQALPPAGAGTGIPAAGLDGASAGRGAGAGAAAVAASSGSVDGVDGTPPWHWSQYPRDPALRQMVGRAAAAEKAGRRDVAMSSFREAVAKAQERLALADQHQTPPRTTTSPTTQPSSVAAMDPRLDLAACQMHLGVFLVSQGFIEQAYSEAGEPAARAFEAHCGPSSLTFASAAYQLAVLAKNNWQSKDRRSQLLDQAFRVQEEQLGRCHAATLATLREKAECTYMGGDFPGGVQLFHDLAMRLSAGADLAAAPALDPPSASAATAFARQEELSEEALEVWFLLTSYMGNLPGREEEVVRICRALIPHKRRLHLRRLYDAAIAGNEYAQDAVSELGRLGFPFPPDLPAATAAGGGMATAVPPYSLPAGLLDPDAVRYDMISHSGEMTNWSTALAKKGLLEAAVRVQWRLADMYAANKAMAATEATLPSGKVTMVEAFRRCLMLDLSVPGVAKVATEMLQKETPHLLPPPASTGGVAAPAPDGAAAAVGRTDAYDGPGYVELVTQMGKLWGQLDYAGAEAVCRQVVRCQAATHGAGSKEVVDARVQLAKLLHSAGRQQDAVAEMRGALALHETILHGKDPAMVYTLQALADILEDRAEGEQLHRRAVALVEKVYGPDHSDVGRALVGLGSHIMADYERLAEGQEVLQRGLAVQAKFQEQQTAMSKAF